MRKNKNIKMAFSIIIFLSISVLASNISFNKGDVIKVISGAGLKVRDNPAGNYIKTEPYNTRGIILEGPQIAQYGGIYYTWWKIRYEDSVEGWSAEGYPNGVKYIEKISIQPSHAFNIGDKVEVYNTDGYGLIVRSEPPQLERIGKVYDGGKGKIIEGPFYGIPSGKEGFYYFWKVSYDSITGWCAENWLKKMENSPPSKPVLTSLPIGYIRSSITFDVYSIDDDGDKIRYGFDWDNDDIVDEWTDFYDSGVTASISHTWNNEGIYSIKAIAEDEYGMKSSWSNVITISITQQNQPPSVAIKHPDNHATVRGTISIQGTANDDNNVVKVEIKIDSGSWTQATGTISWSYSWDTTAVANGQHTIYARSYDGSLYSDIASIDVTVSNELPTIDLTVASVSAPTSAHPGDYITVSWTVSNQGNTASGSFYNRVSLSTTPYGMDISLGNFIMNSISAGSPSSDSKSLQIPSDIASGYYYVTVYADAMGQVDEVNEDNNINHVQIHIIKTEYDREKACNYAKKYWNRVCSDGYFFKNKNYPEYLGNSPVPTETGFDCAHFVSCCIGNEKNERGGGIDILNRTAAYGEPGAYKLIKWLIDNGMAVKVNFLNQLEMGDIIAYDWKNDGTIDHVVLYLGDEKIASHSKSYYGARWDIYEGNHGYEFIHIGEGGGYPVITSSLEIEPKNSIYNVGNVLTAHFVIKNEGSKSINLDELLVGGRAAGEVFDFGRVNVVLEPGKSYEYSGSITLKKEGNYHFFCAYHIKNPRPEEKRLLDENNWNTNIDVELNGKILDFEQGVRYREKNILVIKKTYISSVHHALWKEIGKWDDKNSVLSKVCIGKRIYGVVKYYDDYWGYEGDELYQRDNGWKKIGNGLPFLRFVHHRWPIGDIAISPSNPNIMYIGTTCMNPYSIFFSSMGIYKSEDGGMTWNPTHDFQYLVSSIEIDPSNPDIVYVGTVGGGMWKSENGGKTWNILWNKVTKKGVLLDINNIVCANSNVVYASAYNFNTFAFKGLSGVAVQNYLIKSIDGGKNWEEIKINGRPKIDDMAVGKNPDIIYVITDGFIVYKSFDGGKNWVYASGGEDSLPFFTATGPTTGKICSIELNPYSPNIIYVANSFEKGIYFSPDWGMHWFSLGFEREAEEIFFHGNSLYAVARDGLFKMDIKNSVTASHEHSPAELRIYDSSGRITGLINGKIKEEIPFSIFDNETNTAIIFNPNDTYYYEIIGKGGGKYGLTLVYAGEENTKNFVAREIPISSGSIHEYSVNWKNLSHGKGATIKIDNNGDGKFEKTSSIGEIFTKKDYEKIVKKKFRIPGFETIFLIAAISIIFLKKWKT